jgi:hypothetical protein
MATQTIEFRSPPSQTVTLRLFVQGSDTQVASASATEATNRKGTYAAVFSSIAAGEYQVIATIGTSPIISVASGFVTLTLTTATFYAYAKVELITKPPTAAAIADTTLSSLTSGPSIGGNWPNESFGRRVLVGSSTQREVAVTGSNHVAADVHEFQPDAIDSDAIATSAVTEIAGGVWSAASSAYSAATGTMGLIMYAFSQMLELVTGVWRWKATSLSQAPAGGGGGDASQATLLAVKAKTDLITSQTANQQQTPVNQIAITRGDSYSGSTKITRAVTTDYTGYTATFTIRHRVTNAVLLTKAATVDSSTQLSVALTTTDTGFTLLIDATEFGPHPYDFRLVSGSIEKTEPGIAIIKRDVTT